MKKFLALFLAAALLAVSTPAQAAPAEGRGGFGGALVGCCFGFRTMAAYNDGKSLHIHDILDLLWIGHIWDAIEGWSGTTYSDMQKADPAYF
jgi:hypothetical protein